MGGEWQQVIQAQSSTCSVIDGFEAHEAILCLGEWDPKEVFLLPLRGLDVPLCCVPGRALLSLLFSSYRCLLPFEILSRDTQGRAVGKLAFCWLPCGFLALKEESTVAAQGELRVHEGQRGFGIISLL